jgi:hypothetical protein
VASAYCSAPLNLACSRVAVNCDDEVPTITVYKPGQRLPPRSERREFFFGNFLGFPELRVGRQSKRTFIPVTFSGHDGCGTRIEAQVLESGEIGTEFAERTQHAIPSATDLPRVVVLRRVSRDTVNAATLADLAVVGNMSELWMRPVRAHKSSIASPKDIRRRVLPLSGELELSKPQLALGTAVHLPPRLRERDLTDA